MSRMEKVNELVRREISIMIQQEMQDPRMMMVTVLGADVSPDLQDARIRFSVLGDARQVRDIHQILDRAAGYFQHLLGKRIQLRNTPRVHFIYDPSIEYSMRIEQTLAEIQEKKKSEDLDKEKKIDQDGER
ncbi:MAG: 30S ribosome-binding factor RbfA [Candidatus Omnitrophica bacterium]|nr:30S ribosome-binding factor RbfA [Candidatus Omnitrophota bacterium]